MKIVCLALCAGMLLPLASTRAQQPSPDRNAAPLLLVYVTDQNDDASPRIALGMEKPVLTISAFEKCVRFPSVVNVQVGGLAVQLKPDDAKALAAVLDRAGAPGTPHPPDQKLWFTTPDNKMLGVIRTSNKGTNIINAGVLSFEDGDQHVLVDYLTDKLHPK